jgi:hypothetical protein
VGSEERSDEKEDHLRRKMFHIHGGTISRGSGWELALLSSLFKKYNQEKAMKKPHQQLAARKIKNVVEENALPGQGVMFSATVSTLPAAQQPTLQHRVNVAWGAFNGLRRHRRTHP